LLASYPAFGDEATCLIKPRQVVQVGSALQGILAEEMVDRGDVVKRGQLIARLESSVDEATLALDRMKAANDTAIRAEQADLELNQRMVGRKSYLVDQQVASTDSLDEQQTKVRDSQLRLEQARMDQRLAMLTAERSRRQLELKQIRSPIDGVVTERKMTAGEFVYEQTPIMTLAQIDPLSVELVLPAEKLGVFRRGMTAHVRPSAPVGGDYLATVDVVDPVVDAASNTFGVRLLLPNPKQIIPAGIRCTVHLERGQEVK
jgi:RND family efflux transporter MFP subunit